jgi:hypothetical protein
MYAGASSPLAVSPSPPLNADPVSEVPLSAEALAMDRSLQAQRPRRGTSTRVFTNMATLPRTVRRAVDPFGA